MNNADVIVIGAGPAGMMAAGTAAEKYKHVLLVEKNKQPGQKLLLTGKGRCNITNDRPISSFFSQIPHNADFLYSSLYSFDNQQLVMFFNNLGLQTKVERGGRVFPVSEKSEHVLQALLSYLEDNRVKLVQGRASKIKIKGNRVQGIILEKRSSNGSKEFVAAPRVILATGGLSYPDTGSTGDGLRMAKGVGHDIIEPRPALVPLKTEENWVKEMDYLRLKNIRLSLFQNNERIFSRTGEMEFADFGVAGSLVLAASLYIKDPLSENFQLKIDLKPGLGKKKLEQRLIRDFKKYSRKYFVNSLNDLLPVKIIPVIVELSDIPYDKRVNQITTEERATLAGLIKNLSLNISGFLSMERAIITAGGIKTTEVESSTMESTLVSGLYFAGEILDTAGETGGYNLQIAFSTGRKAGRSV